MAFIGFDLDETLGRFYTPYGYVSFLMPQAIYYGTMKGLEPFAPSKDLENRLQKAFQAFSECLAEKEPRLGILRPGILEILKRFAELKSEGRVKALSVYSNNGNLGCLRLATTMIEYLLNYPGLFCNHIDLFSPIRSGEVNPKDLISAVKTVRTLRASFLDTRCGKIDDLTSVPVEHLYFFDDRWHPQIGDSIEASHYFKVNPYRKDAPIEDLESCFRKAIQVGELETHNEYLSYIAPILASSGLKESFDSIFHYLDRLLKDGSSRSLPFEDDTPQILERLDALFPLESYGQNYFPVSDGGRRHRAHTRRRVKRIKRKRGRKHRTTRKN